MEGMVRMNRLMVAMLLVALLGIAASAFAMEKPMVITPRDGDLLGPSYEIAGSMPYRAFLVVMTDCIRTDTGEVLASVPGIRHWTNDDNSFRFRCAAPRVFLGLTDVPLAYVVRCWETNATGEKGPEAVIRCGIAR